MISMNIQGSITMRTRYSIPRTTSSVTTMRSSTMIRVKNTSLKIPIMLKERKNTPKCHKRSLWRMLLERSFRLYKIKNPQRNKKLNLAPKRRHLLRLRSLSQLLYLLRLQHRLQYRLLPRHQHLHRLQLLHLLKRHRRLPLQSSIKTCLMPPGTTTNRYQGTITSKWSMNNQ